MDEAFQIEKNIGSINAVLSVEYLAEPVNYVEDQWEEFAQPVVEEKKAKVTNDEGEDEQPPAAEPEGEGEKKTAWNPADFKWTITDKRAKNLPQLFKDLKGAHAHFEDRNAENFRGSKNEAIANYIDEFCYRLIDEKNNKFLYQQVIFNQ